MNPNDMAAMTTTHQSTPIWRLAPGQALTLPAAPRDRWLQVHDGELWLTAAAESDELPEDRWLRRGVRWLLPAGREVVLEGHPSAGFQLVEAELSAAASCARSSARAQPSAWRGWAQHWSLLPGPPSGEPCSACLSA